MGPTNVALVTLYQADQELRAAQDRLEAATRNVRIQQRRVDDLAEKLKLSQTTLRESQTQAGSLDLDLKTRQEHIEKLRSQQQNAKTNKEYQAFLVEINTEKVDRNKVEDELIAAMESVEKLQTQSTELSTQRDAEQKKLAEMKAQINDTIARLQADIDALKPKRDAAAAAVPATALGAFNRLAERHEGEAMASLGKPDRRREEYVCNACNMSLVADVYNRLHVRDDLVFCPSCRRILYIPDDLPVELAVNSKRVVKAAEE